MREQAMVVVQEVLDKARREAHKWPVLARRNPEVFAKVVARLGEGYGAEQVAREMGVKRSDVYSIRAQAAQHIGQLEQLVAQDCQMALSMGVCMLDEMLGKFCDQMQEGKKLKAQDLSMVGNTLGKLMDLKERLRIVTPPVNEEEMTLEKVMEMRERARKQRAEAMKLAESVKEDVIDINEN
jgi:hypothetical protein